MESKFSILTVGYGYHLIEMIWNEVVVRTGYELNHVPHPSQFPSDAKSQAIESRLASLHYLFEKPVHTLAPANLTFLAELEIAGSSTVHNVILGDERLSQLPYSDALNYVSASALRFAEIFDDVGPQVVLSGFEGFHNTIAMLVCRKFGIPWFGIVYTSIPKGLTGFSSCTDSSQTSAFGEMFPERIRVLAEDTLSEFESGRSIPYAPNTENSLRRIVQFLPTRFRNLAIKGKATISGNFDAFTHRSFKASIGDYFSRRWNYLTLRKQAWLHFPPKTPYVFFGLHMQPEMGIDVWAPYYSNQHYIIECISRSVPPTHKILVKLHKIDADRWSNAQLNCFRRLPGVALVSADADAREFIEQADLIFSIQGTIALEAALLGRQVISFGKTMYEDLPTVTRVLSIPELPALVRNKLISQAPSREEILKALEKLLSRFRPGLYNNWEQTPTEEQYKDFCSHLQYLRESIEAR